MPLVTNLVKNTDLETDQLTCPVGSIMTGSGTKLLGKPTTQFVKTVFIMLRSKTRVCVRHIGERVLGERLLE